jgi:hypothetical protein
MSRLAVYIPAFVCACVLLANPSRLLADDNGKCTDDDNKATVLSEYVIFDGEKTSPAPPGGYMPDGNITISQDPKCTDNPHGGKACYKAIGKFDSGNWMGVAFLVGGTFDSKVPAVNVFQKLGAQQGDKIQVRFWARSPLKSSFQFKVGGVPGDSITFAKQTDFINLTSDWTQYKIDVTGEDLTAIRAPFIWVTNQDNNQNANEVQLFLDDVKFVKLLNNAPAAQQ